MSVLSQEDRAVLEEFAIRTARNNFAQYCELTHRGLWKPFPHSKFLCEVLERVERGEIKKLIITMPPQFGKSITVTETFPSWFLGKHPEKSVIEVSYSDDFARKFGGSNLSKIKDFGQRLFGVGIDPRRSSDTNWRFAGHRGGMISAGVGGGITGSGADGLLLDDPIKNWEEANSEVYREKLWHEWQNTFRTRVQPGGWIIVIHCMTGDTPVLMADGTERPLRNIRSGDRVATYDKGILKTSFVINQRNNGHDTIYRIKTIGGKSIRANERHPFLVDDEGELRWIKLQDLTTAHKIVTLKDSGANGKERPVWLKDARNPLSVEDIAAPIITKRCGQTGIAPHRSIPSLVEMPTSNTGMASPYQNMMQFSRHKMANAPFVDCPPAIMCGRTGVESYVSTIATKPERSEDSYATIAILPSDTPRPKRISLQWSNTSDFTSERIVSIEPAGIEDVFDVEIERTGNFIANGFVSHNTRWHEDDLTGRILTSPEAKEWLVMNLPLTAGENDPLGRQPGEILWPEGKEQGGEHDAAWVSAQKIAVGPYAWEAQYEGRPTPPGGEILKRGWWKYYKEAPGKFDEVVQSWDCAFKDLKTSSRVSGQVWGRLGANCFLLAESTALMDFPTTLKEILRVTRNHPNALKKYVEDKANGTAAVAVLKNKVPGLILVEPEGGKVSRAQAITGILEAGNVYLPDPRQHPWVDDFVQECASFPRGKYSDRVDAMSQALVKWVMMPQRDPSKEPTLEQATTAPTEDEDFGFTELDELEGLFD